jgi:hypothetical protein
MSFRPKGEIPLKRQLKDTWLDKIGLVPNKILGKRKVIGISARFAARNLS